MGSRSIDRELGEIEADERGGAKAGAAGGVGCFDVGNFCNGVGCRSADSNGGISSEATSSGEATFLAGLWSLSACVACACPRAGQGHSSSAWCQWQ